MPIHSYWCERCYTKKTLKIKFAEIDNPVNCPNCFKPMKRQLFAPAVIYHGNGFSKTDVKKPYDPFDKEDLDKGMAKVKNET